MQFFKYALVFAIVFALLDPTDGGWVRKAWRKAKKSTKRVVKKVVKAAKKVTCKALYGFVCPAGVTAGGAAISASTSGIGDLIVAAAVAKGNQACRVKRRKCKRSAPTMEVMVPFSDVFSDYDMDGDKEITYEEFVIAVLTSIHLAEPSELLEPFVFSDFDGNDKLDTQEFHGAPLLFAHPNYDIFTNNATSPAA